MPKACGILARLRAETRAQHDAIELSLDWQTRASDQSRYRHWLERLYGYHRDWEPAVAVALADPAFVDPRRKLHLLADDLARLGLAADRLDGLPRADAPMRFGSEAEALGSMYVLEGATLGGKLIARHVVAQLEHAPAYHDAYGAQTGAMWRSFQDALVRRLNTLETQDVAVRTANLTFGHLRSWLPG